MDTLVFSLFSLSVAVAIQRAFLMKRGARLRADGQAFRFHALRDDLQILVAEGRIGTSSTTYTFLMRMLNFSIRNAGVVKLRDVLDLAKKVQSNVDTTTFETLLEDIQRHDGEVQKLAQGFFLSFANMLISNDWLVKSGVYVGKKITPAVRVLHHFVSALLRVVSPTRVEAVREARRYEAWGQRLAAPCQ